MDARAHKPGLHGWRSVVLVVLGFAVVVAVLGLQAQSLRQGTESTLRLARAATGMHALEALEWKAIAGGEVADELFAEKACLTQEVQATLDLQVGEHGRRLHSDFDVYAGLLDRELQLLAAGRKEEAKEIDENGVDRTFERLLGELAACQQELEAWTQGRSQVSWLASSLALALVGGLAVLLLRRNVQAQLRAELAEAHEVELGRNNDQLQAEIEARKAVETDLREARLLADQQNEAKSRFVATVSHEIRTPMNGVLGMAESLLDTPLATDQAEQVHTIVDCSRSLIGLLDDVLDFAKLQAGRMQLDPVDFEFRGMIDGVLGLFRAAAQRRGLGLRAEVAAEVPAQLHGDCHRLQQIVRNLVSNAVKFTPSGEVVVKAGVLHTTGEVVQLCLEVVDTGIGIDAPTLQRLFHPFAQADSTTTRHYGGTGLGLAIAQKLAELLGGRIHCTSQVGHGSCFAVEVEFGLPRGRGPSVASDTDRSVPAAVASRFPRVLLADDNPVNQRVAAALLGKWGCDVAVAQNGIEAVQLAATGSFDLVLMDCQMPELDGYEATARIRAGEAGGGRRLPIVAMTANAEAGNRERCARAGMDAFVAKPFRSTQLAAVLAALPPG